MATRMSLLCLFTTKLLTRSATRKSNLLPHQSRKISSPSYRNLNATASSQIKIKTMDIDANLIESAKSQLLQIFDAGVSSVMPTALIENKVRLVEDDLVVDGKLYPLTNNVYLVGFGKAVAGMAYAMEQLLGSRLKRGIISVPRVSYCSKVQLPSELVSLQERVDEQCHNLQALTKSSLIEYREAAENNQPDEASLENTDRIVELIKGLGENDTLIILISGGGSALLFQPKGPVTADAKRDLCKKLQNAGASITELNLVRKQLSGVKGGKLARIAYPAKVITLIMSDIVGDPLNFIASGPTFPVIPSDEQGPQQEAMSILQKYNLDKNLNINVKSLLTQPEQLSSEEQSMIDDLKFKHVDNIIIGNNTTALQASSHVPKKFDLESIILSNLVEGDVKNVSYSYAILTSLICHVLEKNFLTKEEFLEEFDQKNLDTLKIDQRRLEETYEILTNSRDDKGIILLAGGEPTVVVKGSGKGGRNQELALCFSLDWLSQIARDPVLARYFVLFLSVGTDGQDGPTDAAGAFGHPGFRPKLTLAQKQLLEKQKVTLIPDELEQIESKLLEIEGMLPEKCIENVLKDNNSYHFYTNFENGQYLVKTGLTGTNVMDLHFIYLRKRSCECDIQTLFSDKAKSNKPKSKFGDCSQKQV